MRKARRKARLASHIAFSCDGALRRNFTLADAEKFAVGSANGERLIDAARRQWPEKPVRYAFFSHHHPHYTGGLRAAIAAGATVVTTPGNAALVREIAARSFSLAPDRLARAPRPLSVRTFQGRFELADSTNDLVAIDIGTRSNHTDEFVVFWFPRANLLFETEQGWNSTDGKLRVGRRAEGFVQVLAAEKIAPQTFVQSWPMRGTARSLSRAKLDSLVQLRKQGS